MVGKAEAQLTNEGIPYEVGIAHYNELAKGQVRLSSNRPPFSSLCMLLQAANIIPLQKDDELFLHVCDRCLEGRMAF